MLRFTDYHAEPTCYDDWGPGSENNNLISEAGLSRLIRKYESEEDFAIITAYRGNKTKKENIRRNRQLRGELNSKKLGPYQLVGHWQECELEDVPYESCPKDKLKDVVERSYFVPKREDMSDEKFESLIASLCKKFQQDGAVLGQKGNVQVIEPNGNKFKIGSDVSLGKLAQGYSQHVKKMNVPFTFEGVEVPGSSIGNRVMRQHGLVFPILSEEEESSLKSWDDLIDG
jgi:hypothetical protein